MDTDADGKFTMTGFCGEKHSFYTWGPDRVRHPETSVMEGDDGSVTVALPPLTRAGGRVRVSVPRELAGAHWCAWRVRIDQHIPRLGPFGVLKGNEIDLGQLWSHDVDGPHVIVAVEGYGLQHITLPTLASPGASLPEVHVNMEPELWNEITVHVADTDGAPVAGLDLDVEVIYDPEPGHERSLRPCVRAAGEGMYAFLASPSAELRVGASAEGYSWENRTVQVGEIVERIELVLERVRAVRGIVLDAEGRPVVRAGVRVVSPSQDGGRPLAFEVTDDSGRFTMSLPCGELRAEVLPPLEAPDGSDESRLRQYEAWCQGPAVRTLDIPGSEPGQEMAELVIRWSSPSGR